jgi:glyoxylase I family protein
MTDIIGIDHIYIAASDMATSEAFYDRVFLNLGFRKNRFAINNDPHVQYYNRHFGYVLRPANSLQPHNPYAAGLHHFCLRVDSVEDVYEAARVLRSAEIIVSDPKLYPDYAPDYVAIFLSDPDGVRLEITNYRQERRERNERWDS